MKGPAPKWESEAAMLAAFIEEMRAIGFRCVPEHGGHDLLLVVTGPLVCPPRRYWTIPDFLEIGDVIAVEGKLRASTTLLRQVTPPDRARRSVGRSADFYACVVPSFDADTEAVVEALGAHLWVMAPADGKWRPANLARFGLSERRRCFAGDRIQVTDLDIDMPAGSPCPRALTPWKLAAVRLCMEHADGELLAATFDKAGLRARTFLDQGWAEVTRRDGRAAVYRLTASETRPDRHYPEIVAALRARAGTEDDVRPHAYAVDQ